MPNTRHDPDRHLDGTFPRGDYEPLETSERTPLTPSQQNRRARRIEEEHGHRKGQPMMEPTDSQLQSMSSEEKASLVAGIRKARAVLQAGGAEVPTEVQQELTQPELPFDE